MIVIAEIGINHNGDLNQAMLLMKMAKECGADYVKFQKRDVDTVYTKEFLDSKRESPWGDTQRHQKEGLEFSVGDYRIIDEYSKKICIRWFASSWDYLSLMQMDEFKQIGSLSKKLPL
jgi:N-acetylneuraminate synthase